MGRGVVVREPQTTDQVDEVSSRHRHDGTGREVSAAGGVIWRVVDSGLEVVVVHRPKYDDWSFPKGKLNRGESYEHGAVREVEEETGLRCVMGRELASVRYRDGKGRPKRVRYWEMRPTGGRFVPNSEVDEMRWLSLSETASALSHRYDLGVLESFATFAGESVATR